MIGTTDLYRIQEVGGVGHVHTGAPRMPYVEYLAECRNYLRKNVNGEGFANGDMSAEEKIEALKDGIQAYIERHPAIIEGYELADGSVDILRLQTNLNADIWGEGILEAALRDGAVDEIQINDTKTIFICKEGKTIPYMDEEGRLLQFEDNTTLITVLSKIIDDGVTQVPQFNEGHPIMNTKTAKKQYRVNAVFPSASTRDKPPYNEPITTVVIRKFKESHLGIDDLVNSGACTEDMGELITLLGRARSNLFCVGPTGSGKTTLLRIIAATIPLHRRLVMVQNPSEITFFERDSSGRNLRNVVHMEVDQSAKQSDGSNVATMENLISNTLRQTPGTLLVGEARERGEFVQLMRAMRTGHTTLGTFHAHSAADAVERFADEIGGGYLEALRKVAKGIGVVISQLQFEETGERKIMEIAEVLGVDEIGEPVIRTLYRYDTLGEVEEVEVECADGGKKKVKKVIGEHKYINPLSEKLRRAMYEATIPHSKIEKFCREVEKC